MITFHYSFIHFIYLFYTLNHLEKNIFSLIHTNFYTYRKTIYEKILVFKEKYNGLHYVMMMMMLMCYVYVRLSECFICEKNVMSFENSRSLILENVLFLSSIISFRFFFHFLFTFCTSIKINNFDCPHFYLFFKYHSSKKISPDNFHPFLPI